MIKKFRESSNIKVWDKNWKIMLEPKFLNYFSVICDGNLRRKLKNFKNSWKKFRNLNNFTKRNFLISYLYFLVVILLGSRDRQTEKFCWGWAAWATFFARFGLGRVEAFFGPDTEPHLGHIWATFFLEIFAGSWLGREFLAQALGHIWVIFQPGRWVTLGRFFDQGARSHKGDFSKTFSFWVMNHLFFLYFYHRNAPYKIKIIAK